MKLRDGHDRGERAIRREDEADPRDAHAADAEQRQHGGHERDAEPAKIQPKRADRVGNDRCHGDDVCFRTFDPLLAVSYALVHKRAAALSEAAAALHARPCAVLAQFPLLTGKFATAP